MAGTLPGKNERFMGAMTMRFLSRSVFYLNGLKERLSVHKMVRPWVAPAGAVQGYRDSPGCLRPAELHDNLPDIFPGKEPEEGVDGLVDAIDHRLLALQFARQEIAADLTFEFVPPIQSIAHQQPLHREPLGDHVEKIGRAGGSRRCSRKCRHRR